MQDKRKIQSEIELASQSPARFSFLEISRKFCFHFHFLFSISSNFNFTFTSQKVKAIQISLFFWEKKWNPGEFSWQHQDTTKMYCSSMSPIWKILTFLLHSPKTVFEQINSIWDQINSIQVWFGQFIVEPYASAWGHFFAPAYTAYTVTYMPTYIAIWLECFKEYPLNGKNPLKRFWKVPLVGTKHTQSIYACRWTWNMRSVRKQGCHKILESYHHDDGNGISILTWRQMRQEWDKLLRISVR